MEENVVPIKDQTTAEKIHAAKMECAKLFQQAGSLQYEIDCLNGSLAQLNIKLRNANQEGIKLQKQFNEEEASKLKVEEPKNENH